MEDTSQVIDRVPENLQEAVDAVLTTLAQDDRDYILKIPLMTFKSRSHMGGGLKMRNDWNLWDKKSPLHQWFFKEHGIWHADDMSSILLSAIYCAAHGASYLIDPDKRRFEEHWREALGYTGPPYDYLDLK
jgi:hypothetical protein